MHKRILITYVLYSFTPCFGMEPAKPNDGDEKHITGPTRPTYQPRMSEATPLLRASAAQAVACDICLNEYIVNAQIILPCGHSFCERCINVWRAANDGAATCPMCRADVPPAPAVAAGLIAPFAVIPAAPHAHGAEHFDAVDLHHNPPARVIHHPQPIHHAPAVHAADDCHAIAQQPAPVIPRIPAAPIVYHHHIEPQHNHYQDPAGPCCFACWRNFSTHCSACCNTCGRYIIPCCESSEKACTYLVENSCYCCCCGHEDDYVPDRVACCYCCCVEHPSQNFESSSWHNDRWHDRNEERCCGSNARACGMITCGILCVPATFALLICLR